MLEVLNMSVKYGLHQAVKDVTFNVPDGAFVVIIGANGAGKSTVFKAVSGGVSIASGEIRFTGKRVDNISAYQRARAGVTHVPEGRQVFKSLTVEENIKSGVRTGEAVQLWNRNLEMIYDLFPRLKERRRQPGGTLSGGEQQMLAIARGFAACGSLLMLDEPSMGLAPAVVEDIMLAIRKIYKMGTSSILLVEQRAKEALELCTYGYVMESGEIVLEGRGAELRKSNKVVDLYLGR